MAILVFIVSSVGGPRYPPNSLTRIPSGFRLRIRRGAVCAAHIWFAIHAGDQPVWQRLIDFWTESNRPQSLQEILFNRWIVECSKLVGKGQMPTLASSPYSPFGSFLYQIATYG